ncbi:MAG: hypothetical protein HDR04_10490 [Lachnospiraceae bacterium]|nr:hypothetical protein [Lachnospiraceae bacterium]
MRKSIKSNTSCEIGIRVADRKLTLKEIKQWLDTYSVQKLFAYNAALDAEDELQIMQLLGRTTNQGVVL